jgi:hypothetical protein
MPPAMRCPHAEDGQAGHDRPPWAVADLFRLSGPTSRHTHGVSAVQQQGIDAIIACRTAALGGHAARCPQGGGAR